MTWPALAVNVVPLCSDLDPALVPPFVGPDGRHDFVVAGRLGSHKNIDVVLEAWQRHVDGDSWRGDELLLIGDGPLTIRTLPAYVRWRPGSYRYADVVTTLAAAKGSVAHYRSASQSGVQVLSMQLGVMPIVSPVGGLPEYQPPGFPPVGVDDVAGLTAAFDDLSDPLTATLRGCSGGASLRRLLRRRSRRGRPCECAHRSGSSNWQGISMNPGCGNLFLPSPEAKQSMGRRTHPRGHRLHR